MSDDLMALAVFVAIAAIVVAETWACAYQLGRMSAFSDALRAFDATVGINGCGCVHKQEHRDDLQKGAMHG